MTSDAGNELIIPAQRLTHDSIENRKSKKTQSADFDKPKLSMAVPTGLRIISQSHNITERTKG